MSEQGRGVSPKAEAIWCYLAQPDKPFQAGQKPQYKVTLKLDPEQPDHKEFLTLLRDHKNPQGKNVPYKKLVEDDGEGNEKDTGLYVVAFKTFRKPDLWDAKKKAITGDINVGNGSVLRVKYTMDHYSAGLGGLKLYLGDVQILELKEYEGGSGSDGFDEEKGYQGTSGPAKGEAFGPDDTLDMSPKTEEQEEF